MASTCDHTKTCSSTVVDPPPLNTWESAVDTGDQAAQLSENLNAHVLPSTINGDPGLIVSVDGAVDFAAAFEVVGDRVATIWLVRNPDKLEHLPQPIVMS